MIQLPSLQQLRFLSALAEHRHFGRAADACAVTQPTLSAGIQELEAKLGVPLVERSRRNILLTPMGEEILARARRLLHDAEELVEIARGGHEPLSGPLRLGVIPTIGPYLLPPLMRGLKEVFPKLKLYLREEQSAPLIEKLEAGSLDLGLLALPYDLGDLESMPLGQDEIVVALPKDHPLAAGKRVASDQLAGQPLLMLEDGHCLRDHALAACSLTGPDRNEVFQGTSVKTLVEMAASGLGITLLPKMAVAAEVPAEGDLTTRPLAADAPARSLALVWRRSATRKEDFRTFGRHIAKVLTRLAAG